MVSRLAETNFSDVRVEREHLLPFISNCYRSAVRKLLRSYEEKRPAAILVSEGRLGPEHVIDRFLKSVEDDTVVIQIDSSCTDSKTFMQDIIRKIGFDPNDMSLVDLENVFELFLQYQRTHKIRTIIAVQDSDTHGWWVFDKVRRLVELEAQEKYGLKIIVSGRPSLISVLNEPILDVITAQAGDRIVLTPFTLAETRNYIRQHIENIDVAANNIDDVGQVFEFLAVNLIHEICAGVPDDVYRICRKCLEIYGEKGDKLISIDTVKKAANSIGLDTMHSADQDNFSAGDGNVEAVPPGRLRIETPGTEAIETLLDQSCFVIGRDVICNICIHGLRVSRLHAVLSVSTLGMHIVDLGSTNGTTVNGQKVERCEIHDGDVIAVGNTRITYLAGAEQLTQESSIDSTDAYEIHEPEPEPEPCITYLGKDMRFLRTS